MAAALRCSAAAATTTVQPPSMLPKSAWHISCVAPLKSRRHAPWASSGLSRRQTHRHRQARGPVCATAAGYGVPAELATSTSDDIAYSIRPAVNADWWAAADLHCASFYPEAGFCMGPLLRLDRVLALQMGVDHERRSKRHYCCLVAAQPLHSAAGHGGGGGGQVAAPAADVLMQQSLEAAGAAPAGQLMRHLLPQHLREGFGLSSMDSGLVGVIVVDTLGSNIPPRQVCDDDEFRLEPRSGIAYVSNLAVSQHARRCGIARALLRQAEELARGWGCRTAALHCDPSNVAAYQLYRAAGYRPAAKEPKWQALWQGRPGVHLTLLMKKLPNAAPDS